MQTAHQIEEQVKKRYQTASEIKSPSLCCPINYSSEYLKVIPEEIIEKDYGCGDPSLYVEKNDVVLDLGSGGGKICYITSQIVGPKGKVIGIDFNPPMLKLARKYQSDIAKQIGYQNVEFFRGKIQNLRQNLDLVEDYIQKNPIENYQDYESLEAYIQDTEAKNPMIPDNSIDIIISNCVLNLVPTESKYQIFSEMKRVLKNGGRVAISDIVSDKPVPDHLKKNPELWTGCISGAFYESEFIKSFEDAGFYGIKIDKWEAQPFAVIEDIEFRSMTITAYKGKEGICLDTQKSVIYQGPWKQVEDDDQHIYKRGQRVAVCEKTYQILAKKPYAEEFVYLEPEVSIDLDSAPLFNCQSDNKTSETNIKRHRVQSSNSNQTCC